MRFLLIMAGLLFASGLIFSAVYLNRDYCQLEKPVLCFTPEMGINGFTIVIGNSGDKTIYVQDLSVSQKGHRCFFNKIDSPEDYYATIIPGEAATFIIDSIHPDGECLMQGMELGKKYNLDLEFTYIYDGEIITISGRGRVEFKEQTV